MTKRKTTQEKAEDIMSKATLALLSLQNEDDTYRFIVKMEVMRRQQEWVERTCSEYTYRT